MPEQDKITSVPIKVNKPSSEIQLIANDNEVLPEELQQDLIAMGASAAQIERDTGLVGGDFFNTSGGTLKWNDEPLPGNALVCIILDSILEYSFYEGSYHPDQNIGPSCFALGRDVDQMTPHTKVISKQNDTCTSCPLNRWGSADVGRGKKCSNRRRLALIPAGSFCPEKGIQLFNSLDLINSSEISYLRLPVTSVKSFARYVAKINTMYKRPPFGVVTHLVLEPHSEYNFQIKFTAINKIASSALNILMERHKEAVESIDFPYLPMDEQDQSTKPSAKY